MIRVSGLHVYPVKSCQGISLETAEVAARGLHHDREWLVVDDAGSFMTQRDWPALARVEVRLEPNHLVLGADGMAELAVPHDSPGKSERSVRIWKDNCAAVSAGSEAARWFSEFLGTDCELVRMPETTIRQVDLEFARPGDRVGFADGFPLLLISQASLDELNRRLDQPVPMDRFRPNLVVEGCGPHAEDSWSRITVGTVSFRVARACARCVITTTDQQSGARGREPLRTLATYRRQGKHVLFGQNLIHDGVGTLRVGDDCVVERG